VAQIGRAHLLKAYCNNHGMPISTQIARSSLPSMWWMIGGMNVMVLAVFMFALFKGVLPTASIVLIIAASGCVGIVAGTYYTFRSHCGVTASLYYLLYVALAMEFIFCAGAAATASQIAGRPDLSWLAVFANSLSMTITLVSGLYIEAKELKLFDASAGLFWREKLEQYIDYPSHQIQPESITGIQTGSSTWKSPVLIVAIGSANIPLFFELFGGGRFNAIFLVIPVLTCAFAYVNIKSFGPSLLRLVLLRKLETSLSYRFINADFEKIQELRRTFFLSRWLMKDYDKPRTELHRNGV
jgi:hypothetical protein